MDKKNLFAPGPVLTTDRVKKAALIPDICHRRGDFEEIYSSLRKNILKVVKGSEKKYLSVVVTGSGSAANETVISSVIPENGRVLIIINGEFGYRLDGLLDCYNISKHQIDCGWGKYPSIEEIEKVLQTDEYITHIFMVMHETSTGMINPVVQVGNLSRKYNKIFSLDAVSAVGGEIIELEKWNVDYCTGVPNKAVSGQPGVSFVVVNRDRIPEIEKVKKRNIYFNLYNLIILAETKNQTPNTPSVVMFNTFLESLKELFSETLDGRVKRYKDNAFIIRKRVRELGLKILIDDDYSSSTVTSIFLPKDRNLNDFLDEMEKRGFVFYAGKGPYLELGMFQIANMGNIYEKDVLEMLDVLDEVLK